MTKNEKEVNYMKKNKMTFINNKKSLKGLFINHLHFNYFLHAWMTKGNIKFNEFP